MSTRPTTLSGFPCCVRFPCVHAVATTPAQGLGHCFAHFPPALSAFPALAGRSACATSFSRIAQRSLTLRPAHSPSHLMTLYTRGFSHFVTSMTAPIASGWSKIAGWDLHPLRNAALARRTPEPDLRECFMPILRRQNKQGAAPPFLPMHLFRRRRISVIKGFIYFDSKTFDSLDR